MASHSETVHYQALSDRRGEFTFPAAVPGDDYRFWVRPKGDYHDYTKDRISVAGDPVNLEVVLTPLSTGTVTGRVIDEEGRPISQLGLLIYSDQARRQPIDVISDADARFEVYEVPAGMLTFKTRSRTRLRVEGIELQEGEEKYIEIVLDKGGTTLQGELIDAAEYPIGGAQVRLYGSGDPQIFERHVLGAVQGCRLLPGLVIGVCDLFSLHG